MPRPPRLLRATALVVSGGLALLGVSAGAAPVAPTAPAAPVIDINAGALDRGPDPSVPYVAGDVIVDGKDRIPLDADHAEMLGVSDGDYVVWATRGARPAQVLRVTPGGDATVLVRGADAYNAVLSADGTQVVVPKMRLQRKQTVLNVYEASTGGLEATTTVRGFATVLDAADDRAVVGTTTPARTIEWDIDAGTRTTLARGTGYQADITSNRLAVFSGDPFRGGCSQVTTLDAPDTALSGSCTERVYEFSPDGRRMATIALLTDGLGPSRVVVRKVSGASIATYDAPFFFGLVTWETDRALLLQTNARTRSALVRCTRADCERASKMGPGPEVRRLREFSLAQP